MTLKKGILTASDVPATADSQEDSSARGSRQFNQYVNRESTETAGTLLLCLRIGASFCSALNQDRA
jgi:hypothetical protein